jgi:hypothetical protein
MQAKKVTKKQRKAAAKAANDLRAQKQLTVHEHEHVHHHNMNCLSSYLNRQAEAKQTKVAFRNEKRQAKSALLKIARKIVKARKAEARKKREERQAANAQ